MKSALAFILFAMVKSLPQPAQQSWPQNLCQTKGYCGLVIGKHCYDNYQCVSEECEVTERPSFLMSSHASYKSCVVKTIIPPHMIKNIWEQYNDSAILNSAIDAIAAAFANGGGSAAGAFAGNTAYDLFYLT
jgi:hypothetical protein